jgi:hypothetical protein
LGFRSAIVSGEMDISGGVGVMISAVVLVVVAVERVVVAVDVAGVVEARFNNWFLISSSVGVFTGVVVLVEISGDSLNVLSKYLVLSFTGRAA